MVKFSYPFLKIYKLVSHFHKFERWKKTFHIHKKVPLVYQDEILQGFPLQYILLFHNCC